MPVISNKPAPKPTALHPQGGASLAAEAERLRRLAVGEPEPKKPGPPTLKDAVVKVVDDAAGRALWREFGRPGRRGIDRVKLRAELWGTPEGQELGALTYDRRFAGLEVSKARGRIAADPVAAATYRAALRILDRGRFDMEGQ